MENKKNNQKATEYMKEQNKLLESEGPLLLEEAKKDSEPAIKLLIEKLVKNKLGF